MKGIRAFQSLAVACVLLTGHACQSNKELVDLVETYHHTGLTMTGESFLQEVQETPMWLEAWEAVEKAGEPLPNEVFVVAKLGNRPCVALPIMNNGEITHVALYPVGAEEKPEIVGGNKKKPSGFARGFLQARCYRTWERHGLKVSRDLKALAYQNDKSGKE